MWSRRTALVPAAVVALLLLAPARSSAQEGNPLIAEGQQLYDELRYDEALQVLSAALVRPGNSAAEDQTIYQLLAFTYLALRREPEATGTYRRLLAVNPDFQPDSGVSPRFRQFFQGVREQWEAEGRPGLPPPAPVTIRHVSPPQADRNEDFELSATLEDPAGRVRQLVLAYRQGSEDVFIRLDTQPREGELVATIPGADVRPPLVEYYFEGIDADGLPVASRGDVAAPLRLVVPAPSSSIFTKWWFWVAAAAVVGTAVTLGVVLSGGGGGEQPGTLQITVR